MIGYYVHHVGRGHLHRATAVAAASTVPVVGLSSLPRPAGWKGEWVTLPRDDEGRHGGDVTAGGRLHWAPLQDAGLRSRMATLSSWIGNEGPRLLVADVSVEVALLARLHGLRVASFVLPGRRDDEAHLLGFGVSSVLLAAWPAGVPGLLPGLPAALASRVQHVGGLSRFPVAPSPRVRRPGPPRVTVLLGRGGGGPSRATLDAARAQTSQWQWTVLGGGLSVWTDDPFPVIRDADVVVSQSGQNSVAEVAAARRPALVVPATRPHAEQTTTARALASGGWPLEVEPTLPTDGWADRLERLRRLDGERWADWCDGRAAARAAEILRREHDIGWPSAASA